ncbi:MAG: site-specific integrase [Puia sp.]|nr:site-specific integrase [Puia sp.]
MRGTLREAKMKSGRIGLYIDYYPPVWNPVKQVYTRREYLELYLHPDPKNALERQENALNKEIAEKIYLKRNKTLMLDAKGIYNKDILESDFYQYIHTFIKKKAMEKIDTALYKTCLAHLKKWRPEQLKFKDIDELFLEGFKAYLISARQLKRDKKLLRNSQAGYYDKLALIVYQAWLDKYLPEDYTARVKRISNEDSLAARLEPEDVQVLMNTPCTDDTTYRSSLFALKTGFRFSAVAILKWEYFHYSMNFDCWYVHLIDPKPGRPFKHYISKEAMDILGEKKEGSEFVFPDINYNNVRYHLILWFNDAGLSDKARFHNWRRRYASDLSDNDVDIYVIRDMLDHKHVKTTEGYTDVNPSRKVRAAKKIGTPRLTK